MSAGAVSLRSMRTRSPTRTLHHWMRLTPPVGVTACVTRELLTCVLGAVRCGAVRCGAVRCGAVRCTDHAPRTNPIVTMALDILVDLFGRGDGENERERKENGRDAVTDLRDDLEDCNR